MKTKLRCGKRSRRLRVRFTLKGINVETQRMDRRICALAPAKVAAGQKEELQSSRLMQPERREHKFY